MKMPIALTFLYFPSHKRVRNTYSVVRIQVFAWSHVAFQINFPTGVNWEDMCEVERERESKTRNRILFFRSLTRFCPGRNSCLRNQRMRITTSTHDARIRASVAKLQFCNCLFSDLNKGDSDANAELVVHSVWRKRMRETLQAMQSVWAERGREMINCPKK